MNLLKCSNIRRIHIWTIRYIILVHIFLFLTFLQNIITWYKHYCIEFISTKTEDISTWIPQVIPIRYKSTCSIIPKTDLNDHINNKAKLWYNRGFHNVQRRCHFFYNWTKNILSFRIANRISEGKFLKMHIALSLISSLPSLLNWMSTKSIHSGQCIWRPRRTSEIHNRFISLQIAKYYTRELII